MVNKGSATPGRILAAAEELFASEGIDATTLSAIMQAAGARNKTAIAYHFGSKFDLLQAVIDRHLVTIDEHRERLLDEIERSAQPDLAGLVAAMVDPVTAQLETPSGVCYLQIQAALLSYPRRELLPDRLRDPVRRLHRLRRMMAAVIEVDPDPNTTTALIVSLIFHGLADFSRTSPSPAQRERFSAALTAAVHAILSVRERAATSPSKGAT